jgi:hypothetical protein
MLRPKDPEVRVRGLEAVAGAHLEELGEVVVRYDRDGLLGYLGRPHLGHGRLRYLALLVEPAEQLLQPPVVPRGRGGGGATGDQASRPLRYAW